MSGWTPVTEDTLKPKAAPKGWTLVQEPVKEHTAQDKSTIGNYQSRPGGPVLNENQSPDQAGIRALEKSMGIPNQPSSLGDAYKQQLGTLSDATKNAFNEWQEGLQRETGGNIPRSLTAVLAGGMTPIEMIARGIEGIAGGVESGGKSIAEGVKRNDPRAMAAGAGELTGAIGQMIGGEKSGEAVSKIPASASAARATVGAAIHDTEGALTPGAKAGAKIVGGASGTAAGSLFGHEYLGAAAGYKLGPSLLDRMFPESAESIASRNIFENTKEISEAQEAALKEASTRSNQERIATARAIKTEQAARDALWKARDQHAQDLMDRQAAQDKLDMADVKASNAAARARREGAANQAALEKTAQKAAQDAEDARNQHAQDLMDRQKEQDVLDFKHAKALKALEDARQKELASNEKFKQQHAESLNNREDVEGESSGTDANNLKGNPNLFSGPQDLISRTKKLVKPGEAPSAEDLKRAGDMTQVPLSKLKLLALWGDELAKNEINRRLRNQ